MSRRVHREEVGEVAAAHRWQPAGELRALRHPLQHARPQLLAGRVEDEVVLPAHLRAQARVQYYIT